MTLTISLTPEAEARLLERAAAAGKQPAELARAIVEREVRRPTLEEISGPIYQEFLKSGMTDEELGEMLEEAKHAMRADKQEERQ
jgi:hypothetical protein